MYVSVQTDDFDHSQQYQLLRQQADKEGAIVTFTGLVRDFNPNATVSRIDIEHYPGMTEKSLLAICQQAKQRWQLGHIRLIHRVGVIEAKQQIVFVGVSAPHRQAAFQGCEYMIDYLKTRAPFWKREITPQGTVWVASKQRDQQAAQRWDSANK